jgi:hypothetical protein
MEQRNGSKNGKHAKKRNDREEDTSNAHPYCRGYTILPRDGKGSARDHDEARSRAHCAEGQGRSNA